LKNNFWREEPLILITGSAVRVSNIQKLATTMGQLAKAKLTFRKNCSVGPVR